MGARGQAAEPKGAAVVDEVVDTINNCLGVIAKAYSGCGTALSVCIFSVLLVSKQQLDVTGFLGSFVINNAVIIKKDSIQQLEQILLSNDKLPKLVLQWVFQVYKDGVSSANSNFPQIVGGNRVEMLSTSVPIFIPYAYMEKVWIDLMDALMRKHRNWQQLVSEASEVSGIGKSNFTIDNHTATYPIVCSSTSAFPPPLRQMADQGLFEKRANDCFLRQNGSSVNGSRKLVFAKKVVEFHHNATEATEKKKKKKTRYRQLSYVNRMASPVYLIKAVCREGGRNGSCSDTFTVSDDFGIASNTTVSIESVSDIVQIQPKQSYEVTIIWNGDVPTPTTSLPKVKLMFWSAVNGFETLETEIKLIDISEDRPQIDSGTNTEAEPYIANSLSNIFTETPIKTEGVGSIPLLKVLISNGILQEPSHYIISTPLTSFGITCSAWACKRHSEAYMNGQSIDRDLEILRRKFIMQEIKEANQCNSYSLFHVPLKEGLIDFDRRRYEEVNGEEKTGPYQGIILKKFLQNSKMRCLLLDVPDAPEKEPELKAGSIIYLRAANNEKMEFISIVLASHLSTIILLAPDALFAILEEGFRWHCQFSIDYEYYSKIHMSLELVRMQGMIRKFSWLSTDEERHHAANSNGIGGTDCKKGDSLDDGSEVESFLATTWHMGNKTGKGKKKKKVTYRDVISTNIPADEMQQKVLFKVWQALEKESENHEGMVEDEEIHSYNMICVKGPAGTGKSLTATNTATFISLLSAGYKILVCTPEEYTADLLTNNILKELRAIGKKFPHLRKKQPRVLRVNDPKRPLSHSLEDVLDHCKVNSFGLFEVPKTEELLEAQIVVSSCRTCWFLHKGNKAKAATIGFDLCIIDEAGQASVPDALTTLACLHGSLPEYTHKKKTLLMLGDEHQLGPAKTAVFRSILEYWGNERFCSSVIRLKKNYRSNSGLLEIPKALFYGDELNTVASEEETRTPDIANTLFGGCLKRLYVDKSSASVLTLGVDGKHARSSIWSKGKSFSNSLEGEAVKDICADFVNKKIVSISQIGIVALSRAQVMLIREKLRNVGLGSIRCGTVDDFQGQQSDVILLSCVASTSKALDLEEKRFNVAITRARRLLIVVGSLKVLRDKKAGPWYDLATYCTEKGLLLELPSSSNGSFEQASKEEEKQQQQQKGSSLSKGYRETTMSQLTDLAKNALLGVGFLSHQFPDDLDEFWGASDEPTARIQL